MKEKEGQLQDQETLQKKYKELETEKEELEAENARVVEEIDDLKKKRYMRKISQDVFTKCLFSIENLHDRV